MILTFYPFDSLFFKDGKPFEAGTDTIASGFFPPFPSTIYGALRGLIAINMKKGIAESDIKSYPEELRGTIDECKLKISGIFLYNRNSDNFLFPTPFNLVENEDKKLQFLIPENNSHCVPIICKENFKPANKYVEDIEEILIIEQTKLKTELLIDNNELFKDFFKTGIKLDYSKGVTEESQLYTAKHYRLNDNIGIAVKIESEEFYNKIPDSGVYKLGGEMRPVSFEKIDSPIIEEDIINKLTKKIAETKRFFFWLITPAIFQNGNLPDFINEDTKDTLKGVLSVNNENLEVEVLSYQMDKPMYIGGFDIEKRIPKPMYKAVNAGAIYFFKIISNPDEKLIENFIKKYITKPLPTKFKQFSKQGFGSALIGGW